MIAIPFILALSIQNSVTSPPKVIRGDDVRLPAYFGPKKRAAVPGFAVKVSSILFPIALPSGGYKTTKLEVTGNMDIGDGMADMLNTALIASKRFIVLERKDIADVTAELALPGVDPASVAGPGKLLGAQILIRGALTELSYSKSNNEIGGGGAVGDFIDAKSASFTANCAIDLKVIEVETGRVLESVRTEGHAYSKAKSIDLQVGDIQFGQQKFETMPLAKAIRNAIDLGVRELCKKVDDVQWEGRIATITEKDGVKLLYLNFGTEVGIKDGDALQVFRPGATVIDPQSRIVIGREDDVVLGKCRIRNGLKSMTVAMLTEGTDIKVGDAVRLMPKLPKN
jgi:curli biogenesis system outer membrane secretion channel CsgG